jgi:L-asparaginase
MSPTSDNDRIVVLGTGGTIAGTAASPDDVVGYRAGQIGIDTLLAGVSVPSGTMVEAEQVAQIDSKDMTHAIWQTLAQRVAHHLARPEVAGIVITHGTDTLEETAWFLQRVLARGKPVVLTGAMRPATAREADGPQNLSDAITLAREPGLSGVLAVLAGTIHDACDVRKAHPLRLDDAFASGDAGPLGVIAGGRLRWLRLRGDAAGSTAPGVPSSRPAAPAHPALSRAAADWPRVEIITSHAGATGALMRALCADGVDGIVVAATGNGSVNRELQQALVAAQATGLAVLCSTRSGPGRAHPSAIDRLPMVDGLTPAKARVELMLRLMERDGA